MQERHGKRPPLTATRLEELALSYVGRFATSRTKLQSYLARKVRERGWAGDGEPPVAELAEKCVNLGYVDDEAFALARARSLTSRGYGARRVEQALAMAGIDEGSAAGARELAEEEAVNAALHFARRRAIGPFAVKEADARERERALAAMIRAGHRFALARAIVDLKPGEDPHDEGVLNLC